MVLLSQMFRQAAITGRTDTINPWFTDRQGAAWVERTTRAAFPVQAARSDRAAELYELRRRGIITDEELARLHP